MRCFPPLHRFTGPRIVNFTLVRIVETLVQTHRPLGDCSARHAHCRRLRCRRLLSCRRIAPYSSRVGGRAGRGPSHRPVTTGRCQVGGRPTGILARRALPGLSRVGHQVRGTAVVGAVRTPRPPWRGPEHARRRRARWSRGVAVGCLLRAGVGVHAGVRAGLRLPVRLNADPQPDPWTGQQPWSTSDNTTPWCRDKPLPGGFPVGRNTNKHLTPGRPWRWR
jgi:hypothetical protein